MDAESKCEKVGKSKYIKLKVQNRYNVIGDIHGRINWKQLVDPARINIFLGDYFDPYDRYSYEHLRDNFLEIMQFAKTNPGTILLLGNHDLHYIHYRDESRLDVLHEDEIKQLLLDNMHLFQGIAYAIGNDILISHAGFTKEWCEYSGYVGDGSLQSYVDHANNLLWDGYVECSNGERYWDDPCYHGMREFTFQAHMKFSDYYGTSPGQSPVWIRPDTLRYCSACPEKDQVVGHTQKYKILPYADDNFFEVSSWDRDAHDEIISKPGGRLILCDVLGQTTESLLIDYEGPGDYKYKVNHIGDD